MLPHLMRIAKTAMRYLWYSSRVCPLHLLLPVRWFLPLTRQLSPIMQTPLENLMRIAKTANKCLVQHVKRSMRPSICRCLEAQVQYWNSSVT